MQLNKEFADILWRATFCAFRRFSSDNIVAVKILLSSKRERCYYSFRRDLLFQMTYLTQCGVWFVANCHVFLYLKNSPLWLVIPYVQ